MANMLTARAARISLQGLLPFGFFSLQVKIVELVDLIEMRKTDCFEETRLVPHTPSSS